jgi:hypothetical protein
MLPGGCHGIHAPNPSTHPRATRVWSPPNHRCVALGAEPPGITPRFRQLVAHSDSCPTEIIA